MHKRVSSGERYTSSGDNNARTIIAPIIDRSMANASSTACHPVSVFFFGVRIMLGMTFNYLILWARVKGQGQGFG